MTSPRTSWWVVWLGLCLAGAVPLAGAATRDAPADASPRGALGGRLIWDLADDLDLLGDLWTELPFRLGAQDEIVFALETRTSIARVVSTYDFEVRDLDYAVDVGWRSARWSPGGAAATWVVGQRGKERVDTNGQPWVRYAALVLESPEFSRDVGSDRDEERFRWRVLGGPVLAERDVRAQAVVRGEARWRALRLGPRSSADRPALDLALSADGLVGSGRVDADLAFGPWLAFPVGSGAEAAVFLEYQRSRNPLGIGHSALLAGFSYAAPPGERRAGAPPRIDGLIAPGAGVDGRLSGRLLLHFVSPPLGRGLQGAILVDANVLTARDTGELFYRYEVGLERRLERGLACAHFYHRSNHALAEPNNRVTSVNAVEIGLETPHWGRPGRPPRDLQLRGLDSGVTLGYLLDSSFGEDRRWLARGGLRWRLPCGGSFASPYVSVQGETGGIEARIYAVGLAFDGGLDVQVEYRRDEQYFSEDRTAVLITASYAL